MPDSFSIDDIFTLVDNLTPEWEEKRNLSDQIRQDLESNMDAAAYELFMYEEFGWMD